MCLWLYFLVSLGVMPASASVVQPETTKDEAVELAREALQAHLDEIEADIRVRSIVERDWTDTSLGCPAEGESYEERPIPGYRVLLEIGGRLYPVHLGGGRAVVCGGALRASSSEVSMQGEVEGPSKMSEPLSREMAELVRQAKEDLAERLSATADAIDLVEVKRVVWPDTSLGCPRPGMEYIQVPRDGALIRLRSGDRTYDYHSGAGRAPFLCEKRD